MVPNYMMYPWGECDMLVVTHAGYTIEYEIKISVSDFRADFRNKSWKHDLLRDPESTRWRPTRWRPTRFFFVVPDGLIPLEDVPAYAGLVYASLPHHPTNTPVIEVVRAAPRLSSAKVSDAMATKMRLALVNRFWNERFRFDDYRRDAMRMRMNSAPAPGGDGT